MACIHKWSTIKRWKIGKEYFVIQRCRRCDDWIRRNIALDGSLVMKVERIREISAGESETK